MKKKQMKKGNAKNMKKEMTSKRKENWKDMKSKCKENEKGNEEEK